MIPDRKPTLEDWLRSLEMEAYLELFHENEVDFETLQILSDADLKELGLPFGPRKRLLGAIADHRRRNAPAQGAGGQPAIPDHRVAETLERRQLTAMFCDMVGFTDLAGRVDAETLQGIIKSYEHDCSQCIERFGGHVLHCLGDGIVALFGFPVAHEDEAERAIRAGFRIIETMAQLPVQEVGRLRVRVGIANGMVVVSATENRAIGETLNIAARLQGIAESDTIVVTERVRILAGGAFEYADLGATSLKGVARPIRIFRPIRPRATGTRFEAAFHTDLAPLVGRTQELARLLEAWAQSREGHGRMVLLSGEPGIGKSRVTAALRDRLESEGALTLVFQCSAHYVDSAFHPFLEALERALDWTHVTTGGGRLDRLEALMVGRYGRPVEDVRMIGSLLSLPCQDRYGAITLTPQRRKEATVRALVDLFEAIAHSQPCLVLFEDLHWADPTTLEVLDTLAERIGQMPLLMVLTARQEFEFRWGSRPAASVLPLGRLNPEEIQTLVAGMTAQHSLPADLVGQIVSKTDGVPLFVEELTRSLMESGDAAGGTDALDAPVERSEAAIPATLRDLLMARLDRVAEVKEIAQIGAVIGREFSHELILAVAPMSPAVLENGLKRLIDSGLAFQSGTPPDARYLFKHALVQDAAYDSLLKSRRRDLHGSIAKALEARFQAVRESKPELLAHHYTEAGLPAPAVTYWHRAGELAMRRFAHREAIAHLRRGLSLVETLPPGSGRDLSELELRTQLGPAVVAHGGWTAPEIGGLLEPALSVARSLQHRQSYLPILHGLWVNSLTLGRLARSRDWAGEMLSTARETGDSDLKICGHRAAMTSSYWLGDLNTARRHGDVIRSLYDPKIHGHISKLTNSDPLTGDGIYRSQYLWMLGYPDQALEVCLANHTHARRLNHPFDLAFALTLGSQVFEFCGEPDRLMECAGEGERVGREHRVPVMSDVLAEISKGVAWLRADRGTACVPQLRKALTRLVQSGQRIWVPYIRALLAEAVARTGAVAEGLELLEESLHQIEAQEERPHLAEVLRLKGCLLIESHREQDGEESLRKALEFSRDQGSRSWELRAAMSLARLLARRDEKKQALEVLEPVHAWFTEGFNTRDLRESAALLDELRTATG